MGYKYFVSGSPTYFKSTKADWVDGFQSFLDEQFENSTTLQDIEEETVFGSGSYTNVTVRVNTAISSMTGEKLGDDFKKILFSDLGHATGMGFKYRFTNCYWVTTNTEIIKNLAASAVVRRCNNVLRWVDSNGNIYTEPCAIDYIIARPRDEMGAVDPVNPSGYINIFCQLNDNTKHIKGNQRFLFGNSSNRVAFRVFGNGVRNFLNQETTDDTTASLLQLTLGGDYVNDLNDDILNGIADRYKENYILTVSPTSISGSVGNIFQIVPTLNQNGYPSNKSISYSTSGSDIASVSGSGLVTLLATGSCVITSYMTNNTSASAVTNILVSGSIADQYEVRITPNPTYILQGDTQSYSCVLYANGIAQPDAFSFISGSAVPSENYTLTTTSGSSFSVSNEHLYLDSDLEITCTSGSYSKTVEIELRGSW